MHLQYRHITYPYMPPPISQAQELGQFGINLRTSFTNLLVVSNPKEFKEQERLKRELITQVGNSEA